MLPSHGAARGRAIALVGGAAVITGVLIGGYAGTVIASGAPAPACSGPTFGSGSELAGATGAKPPSLEALRWRGADS
jgi:hypothetical protein